MILILDHMISFMIGACACSFAVDGDFLCAFFLVFIEAVNITVLGMKNDKKGDNDHDKK